MPAVNNSGESGRWTVAEFTHGYAMEAEFTVTPDAAVSALLTVYAPQTAEEAIA